ncbi:MAG: hypothetical protein ACT4OX_00970 [Actinomycetota bacterium]
MRAAVAPRGGTLVVEDMADPVPAPGEARAQIDVNPMITGRCGIDGVPAAFDALGRPEEHVKIPVEPGAPALPEAIRAD